MSNEAQRSSERSGASTVSQPRAAEPTSKWYTYLTTEVVLHQVRRSQSVGLPHDAGTKQPREADKVSPVTPSQVGRGREADELRTPTPTTAEADPAARTGLSPLTQHLSRVLTSACKTDAISSASKPVATMRRTASDEQTTKGMLPAMKTQDDLPTLSLQMGDKTAYPTVMTNGVPEQHKAPLQTAEDQWPSKKMKNQEFTCSPAVEGAARTASCPRSQGSPDWSRPKPWWSADGGDTAHALGVMFGSSKLIAWVIDLTGTASCGSNSGTMISSGARGGYGCKTAATLVKKNKTPAMKASRQMIRRPRKVGQQRLPEVTRQLFQQQQKRAKDSSRAGRESKTIRPLEGESNRIEILGVRLA
ncbi:hypothetical protein PF008_g13008 [Phytophthora fragariae]|uniref:Uncharacterized protein n=1 Tax=Phytophthora fragariae TaxID=53985 RepID=A0A6G0RLP9_9STRA|nr:hypothetical protein PF008_g13008 [Phytophthora fragariae]